MMKNATIHNLHGNLFRKMGLTVIPFCPLHLTVMCGALRKIQCLDVMTQG